MLCYMREHYVISSNWGHTCVTTEDVVRGVLHAGTSLCDFVQLRTHRCYDRGRGTCCVTCGNICDIVKLRTHRCYDRGRGACCVTSGNILQ